MRTHKTGRDKEWGAILGAPCSGGFQSANGFRRHAAVGVVVILGHRCLKSRPARQRPNGAELLVSKQGFFAGELAAVRAFRVKILDHLVVKMRNAEGLGITQISVPDVKHFAQRFRAIPVLRKMLRHRHRIRQHLPQLTAQTV